jgi:hypothetical protein
MSEKSTDAVYVALGHDSLLASGGSARASGGDAAASTGSSPPSTADAGDSESQSMQPADSREPTVTAAVAA